MGEDGYPLAGAQERGETAQEGFALVRIGQPEPGRAVDGEGDGVALCRRGAAGQRIAHAEHEVGQRFGLAGGQRRDRGDVAEQSPRHG